MLASFAPSEVETKKVSSRKIRVKDIQFDYRLTSIATSRCLFLVVVKIWASEQVPKDQSWNVAFVFTVHDNRNTIPIVLYWNQIFLSIDIDVEFVHVLISLFVISRIHDNWKSKGEQGAGKTTIARKN